MSTTSLIQKEGSLFKSLLYVSAFRGLDSTGMFSVQRTQTEWKAGQIHTVTMKDTVPSPAFIYRAEKAKMFEDLYKKRALVGHCRAATLGKVSVENAHPFEFENVVGVHNGTIRQDFKHSKVYETDSEALYKNINDHGIEDALNEVETASAAYALAYFDFRDLTMNFVRNLQRPLWMSFTDNKKTLIFASAPEMIRFVADMHNIKLEAYNKDTAEIWYPPEHELFSFPILDVASFSEHSRKKLKIKKKIYPVSTYYGYGSYSNQKVWDDDFSGVAPAFIKKETRAVKRRQKKGHKGDLLSEAYHKALIDDGCSLCRKVPEEKEQDKVVWYDKEVYICPSCVEENEWVRDFLLEQKESQEEDKESVFDPQNQVVLH